MNDELEKLLVEATIKGQLRLRDDGDCYVVLDEADEWLMCNTSYYPSAPGWEDAALIVAAVNALPELLALREEVERLKSRMSFSAQSLRNHPTKETALFTAERIEADIARAALNQETKHD